MVLLNALIFALFDVKSVKITSFCIFIFVQNTIPYLWNCILKPNSVLLLQKIKTS